jgi:two-component system, cell cycle sensor histidine kinase and response regulator CckA
MSLFPDPTGRPARILIVDDERHNRQLLEVMLSAEGFVLQTASSGEHAISIVETDRPELILLDVMMPEMDGYEVTSRIKSNPLTKNIPIIMITAMDDRAARVRGLTAGAEDFLTKPVDRTELCMRVRNLLRLKAFGDYHDKYSKLLEGEVGLQAADLVESEARFRQLADTIEQVFFLVNPVVTQMFYVSPAYSSVFGRSCASVYADARSWSYDIPAGERERVMKAIMPSGTLVPFDVEFPIVRGDGAERTIRARGYPISNDAGEVFRFAGLADDVTERRKVEAQLRQSSRMDAVGQLASGIAHDFNNLLSVILTYSELLAADLKEGDPVRADLCEIREAGRRATGLTRQLLAFSRQQVLVPQVVDLTEIVVGMEKMLARLIGEDVELCAIGTPGLATILVDPGQMEQVIMNLAVNARDAMPRGGKLTIETMEIDLDEAYCVDHVGVTPGRHVMMAVSDNGAGMDQATQARMFDPFFTTKEVGKGTGLGLATVFGIVRQSGGTISVYSEPGKGTTFKVYFPMVRGEVAVRPATSPSEHGSLRGSETILVVEDEERVRALVCTILRRYGYHALEAQSGGDAFLLCEQHTATIHLLLTDVVMPRMNGRELAERLLLVRPQMKVLYMSGYTNDTVLRHGILGSAFGFIQKPITPSALAHKVRETLDNEPTLSFPNSQDTDRVAKGAGT